MDQGLGLKTGTVKKKSEFSQNLQNAHTKAGLVADSK